MFLTKILGVLLDWMPYWLAVFCAGFLFTTFALAFAGLVVKLFAFLRKW